MGNAVRLERMEDYSATEFKKDDKPTITRSESGKAKSRATPQEIFRAQGAQAGFGVRANITQF